MNKKKAITNADLLNHIYSLNRSMAKLRLDIPEIVRNTLAEIIKKELQKPKLCIERGYQG